MSNEKPNVKINLEDLATFCKKKGFVFQAGEIYGGLAGFFDFGPLGVELKNNLKNLYWKEFVHKREDMVGQDGAIITNPKVWKASGHVDTFGDMLLTTKDTKTKLRADHFIEDELKIPGDALGPKEIEELIVKNNLKYNGEDFELPIQFFSGMLNTQIGADVTKQSKAYLRPETAQSIFPNFKIIAETSRQQLPFGITQIGKAYRNEISPRDFVFRCREFEQIEMEYFYHPESTCEQLSEELLNTKLKILTAKAQDNESFEMIETTIGELHKDESYQLNTFHAYWLAKYYNWLTNVVGLKSENLRIRQHVETELSHYSTATFDIDYNYPMGFKEMLGMANRGNYDLTQHQTHSKTKMEIFDEKMKSKAIPHVIEPSMGVERFMMAVLYEGYTNDTERGNIVLNISPKVAPYKVAIFPLVNKAGLPEVAREIFDELIEEDIQVMYDKAGSVGKRYARADEIGIPYCLTIDFESLGQSNEDDTAEEKERKAANKGTVTIRDRETGTQTRIEIENIPAIIKNLVKGKVEFKLI
jgi:glycyl-tRNA synthetase